MAAQVVSVNRDELHRFGKQPVSDLHLIAGLGVQQDAHAGEFVQHRYSKNKFGMVPNRRQVHLIQSELFAELELAGYAVNAGNLGENLTTVGIDLLSLPLATTLLIGDEAAVELTGLRTPCGLIDKFQKGLQRYLINKCDGSGQFKAGVFGIVLTSGIVRPSDTIRISYPDNPRIKLPNM